MNDTKINTGDIIKEIGMCIIIALTGMFGITGVIFTGNALSAYPASVYMYEIIIVCIVVICISLPKIRKKFSIAYGISAVLFFAVAHKSVIKGFIHIVNQLETFFRTGVSYADTQQTAVSAGKEQLEVSGQEALAIFLFMLVLSYIISFTVVYIRSMILAIIEILPFMCLFIAFSVIPSSLVCTMCLTYVFSTASLTRKKNNVNKTFFVYMACVAAGVILIVADVVNNDYKRPQIFVEWGQNINSSANGLFNGNMSDGRTGTDGNNTNSDNGTKVTGLTNDGAIGEADSIEISSNNVARIITPDTGKDLYIPTFTSYNYYYGGNKWTRALSVVGNADEQKVDMIEAVFSSDVLKNYVDGGTGDFERSTKIYTVTRTSGDKSIPENITYIDINPVYIPKLVEIMQEKTDLPYGFSTHIRTEMELRDSTAHKSGLGSMQGFSMIELNEFYPYRIKGAGTQDYLNSIQFMKDFFRKNYKYTLAPGRVPDGRDAVEYFLMDSKEGYCTYFASSAAALLRAINIPSRYVEGYRIPAERIAAAETVNTIQGVGQNSDSVITESVVDVKSSDAHAWVEAYIDGYGWITVDVTPSSQRESDVTQDEQVTDNGGDFEQESTSSTDGVDSTDSTQTESDLSQNATDESGNSAISGGKAISFLNVLWKIILIAAAVLFIIIFIARCAKKKKHVNSILNSQDITLMFNLLENLLEYSGYKRINMDYEEYAEVLWDSDDIFKINDIKAVIDYVLKIYYGRKDMEDMAQTKLICRKIKKIREGIYAKMNPVKRFILKNIICM